VSLLLDPTFVALKDLIDDPGERIQLRTHRRRRPLIPGRNRMLQDLGNRLAIDPEQTRRWAFIEGHATDKKPMPDWVVAYLKTVARKINENLGPMGALSREDAHLALDIDGVNAGWKLTHLAD
jgi:hypothetical protein